MRLRLVSAHLPEREGTATGRLLRAVGEGLLAEGHHITAVCWTDRVPREELPPWAQWRPVACGAGLKEHLEAVLRPRWASRALALEPDPDVLNLAEEPPSYAAVHGLGPSAVVVHYSCLLDARALGRVRATDWQGHRADRRAVQGATVALSYSERVGASLGSRVRWIPAAISIPDEALPLVAAPTALLMAGWGWAPNRDALAALLADWPEVRARCPGAVLAVAGRGSIDVGTTSGVRVVGEVARVQDAFSLASVLAFPCPPSSGPKVKVLEAMAAGLPVVTTPAGVEGLAPEVAAAAEVVPLSRFAERLADVLSDEERRAELAARARAAVAAHHAPRVAAAARITAIERQLSAVTKDGDGP